MERWRARLAVSSDAPEPAQVLTAYKFAKQLRFSYWGNALTLGHWPGDCRMREWVPCCLPSCPARCALRMHLQDEGAAAAEQQAGEQEEQQEADAEFQYMHEDESAAAGDTQVCTCPAGNLCVPCCCLV
jgi:anaerobic selenocysteine-containing dehydrogenase